MFFVTIHEWLWCALVREFAPLISGYVLYEGIFDIL
jgi:hypothetical protein